MTKFNRERRIAKREFDTSNVARETRNEKRETREEFAAFRVRAHMVPSRGVSSRVVGEAVVSTGHPSLFSPSTFHLSPSTFHFPHAARRAFSLIELLVVVLIIAVVLGFGLPAFNTISKQSRQAKAEQLVNGALVRAATIAAADRTLTAVRFSPAAWDQSSAEENQSSVEATGAQVITIYRYAASSLNPNPPSSAGSPLPALFHERFERIANQPSIVLPADSWVAPIEALTPRNTAIGLAEQSCRDTLLQGTIGQFELNADARDLDQYGRPAGTTNEQLLDADDFLIVFDPETGVKSSTPRTAWRMYAHDPRATGSPARSRDSSGEWTNSAFGLFLSRPYQRFNASGVILYPREQFRAAGLVANTEAQLEARRLVLERLGRKAYVSQSGGLVGVE